MLIDVHTHLTIFSDCDFPKTGNILKPDYFQKKLVNVIKKRFGISLEDENPDAIYVKNFSRAVRESRSVDKACVMALDGIYDSAGNLDIEKTTFLISNDYLFNSLRDYPNLLPIASVNPMRSDALDELDRVIELGTVAIKILPNSQGFNPVDKTYIPFYRKMKENNLSLICHSGYEFALTSVDQSLGHPKHLRTPLDEGVTCVSAHGGGTGMFVIELYGDILRELAGEFPHYYIDTSAVTLPTRYRNFLKIIKDDLLKERLVFGTDYPVPDFTVPFIGKIGYSKYRTLSREKNFFNRYVDLFNHLGLDMKSMEERSEKIIRHQEV